MHQTTDGVLRRVKAVFLSCLDVMLLRVGPQVFPRSRVLLGSMLLGYFLTDALDAWLEGYSVLPMVLQSAFDTGLWVSFYGLIFGAWSLLPRLQQTLTAWFGAGVLFNLMWLPLDGATRFVTDPDVQAWLILPVVLLIVWAMMVMAYLLRHALRTGLLVTLPIAVACGLISILLLYFMFPLA